MGSAFVVGSMAAEKILSCERVARDGNLFAHTAVLESERSIANVSQCDVSRRAELIEALRRLPSEALTSVRHFQTQVGCLNRCAFCSQSAGTTIWNLPRQELANLIAAIKTVACEVAISSGLLGMDAITAEGVFSESFVMPEHGLIGYARNDRPGVIYCYLDNDPASYPHLDDMIRWLHEDLGVKVRIATVGFSRRNLEIAKMHDRIGDRLLPAVAGIRLSFSPYTFGWTTAAERAGDSSRAEFEQDTAHFLATYRKAFLFDLKGRKGASVEIRFRPLVVSAEVTTTLFEGHVVLRSGPYLVMSRRTAANTQIASLANARDHAIKLSGGNQPCWLVYGHPSAIETEYKSIMETLLTGEQPDRKFKVSESTLHCLENEDGIYFSVDAERQSTGIFAKFFYPANGRRPGPGYIDGERYFLNELIAANASGQNKTWDDARNLARRVAAKATEVEPRDPIGAGYIREQVCELIESYLRALKLAKYPAAAFFDKNITIDTGHICNLGRAYHEYRSIASRADLPLTPHHERAFGPTGELANEGLIWRIAVQPYGEVAAAVAVRGVRNLVAQQPSILVEKLDLAMTATPEGQSRERYSIAIPTIHRLNQRDTQHFPLIPGHLTKKLT